MKVKVASRSTDTKPGLSVRAKTQAYLRGGWREALKVVNSFALLEPTRDDASLVLLVHSIGKLDLQTPLARDGFDAGRKSRNLDSAIRQQPIFSSVLYSRSCAAFQRTRSGAIRAS